MIRPAQTEQPTEGFHYWSRDENWESVGQGRGDVVVPAGHQVFLLVYRPRTWRDLSPLLKLQPDDLYALSITGPYGDGSKPGDSCMRYVAHLTGLRSLSLARTNITAAGMRRVTALKELRWLTLPERMGDRGLVYVAQLPALTGLYFKKNHVTSEGIRYIARLGSLAELELGGGQITDGALAHLAQLPRLRYLLLWGKGFSDAGFAHLKNIPALEILNLGPLSQTSDAGLRHVSQITQLEVLSVHESERISDRGLAYLKKLPHLRKLDIFHAKITESGLLDLKQIKTLESLIMPRTGITDAALCHVSELTRLKDLDLPSAHYVNPQVAEDSYTDEGLRALSTLASLETLHAGGPGITDEGVRHVAKLTKLKSLFLFGCSYITDDSLRMIAKLGALETLDVAYGRLTVSGTRTLNSLTRLSVLRLKGVRQDNSGLDFSGLTGLRELSFDLASRQVDGDVAAYQEQDIAAMGQLTNLRRLGISHSGIPDGAVLRHLTGLKHLNRLGIGGNGMTDEGLAYLAELPLLTSLTLSGTFTDRGLSHLQKLQNLEMLDFRSGANFSPRALSQFRSNTPNLVLYRDFEKR